MKIMQISIVGTEVMVLTDHATLPDVRAQKENLIELIAELANVEIITACRTSEVTGDASVGSFLSNFVRSVPGVKFAASGQEMTASIQDGDTGYEIQASGDNIINSLGNLLRLVEYKSKSFADNVNIVPGALFDYLRLITYGRQRRSDEIFQMEMEATLVPDKGSW